MLNEVFDVIDEITDFLFGLKMTILSGIFLLIAIIFMIFGISTPIYLNPAWGTVIISGIPMLLLAMTRLIREKWISSALLIAIAMIASLLIGEIFAAGEVAWIMALGALLEDWTVESMSTDGTKQTQNSTEYKIVPTNSALKDLSWIDYWSSNKNNEPAFSEYTESGGYVDKYVKEVLGK